MLVPMSPEWIEEVLTRNPDRRAVAEAAIAKGIRIDDMGVPQADPHAVPNLNVNDMVTWGDPARVGVIVNLDAVGGVLVESEGQDYIVAIKDLRPAVEGI